jgi:hypothetical protein
MARGPRQAPGGLVYHALNRAVARLPLFEKPADYAAFERVMAEALEEAPTKLPANPPDNRARRCRSSLHGTDRGPFARTH